MHWSLRKAFLSLLVILWNSAFKWVYVPFLPLPLGSLLFSAICKVSSDNHFTFLHFFSLGMALITVSCTMSWTYVHSSSGTLSIRSNLLNLSVTSTVWGFNNDSHWNTMVTLFLGLPGGSDGKESACNVGDPGLIPESGRTHEEGNGYSLHYSSLENSLDRGYSPCGYKEFDTTEWLTLFHSPYFLSNTPSTRGTSDLGI